METTAMNTTEKQDAKTFAGRGLLYGAAGTLCLNIAAASWFFLAPSITAKAAYTEASRPTTQQERMVTDTSKPSAFEPVVDESKQVRHAAAKARPMEVSLIQPETATSNTLPPYGAYVMHTVYEQKAADPSNRPVNTTRATSTVLRGDFAYQELDQIDDMPRMTATAYRPAASSPVVVRQ